MIDKKCLGIYSMQKWLTESWNEFNPLTL